MSSFLGLDFSTQKLKAVVLDEDLEILHGSEVDFDRQLPEFRTQGGVRRGENGVVTTPVTLWIKAIDLLLDQMKLNGIDFSKVKAISGAAQQHGLVLWQKNAREKLKNLDSSQFLFQQLQECFSLKQSPVWMDSSTSAYCKAMEDAVGGPTKMAEITGSRAFERFSGPQIAKICDQRSDIYGMTERISLISSFACSIFGGKYADVDYAEASGTNLMDIKTKKWHEACLEALKAPTNEDVREKLGNPLPPHTNLGNISQYFVDRFGFDKDCKLITFTGDNPATLAGMKVTEKDLAISLGTSDTVMYPLTEPKVFTDGHVMCSALNEGEWMALLCFKNGSLTRERLKKLYADNSWDEFNRLLDGTPRGNFGNMALYFDAPEIFPSVKKGDYRWNSEGKKVMKFRAPEIEVRALIEGQFLARRSFAEDLGFKKREESRIIATGGASSNTAILQILSDVFNVPVYVQKFGDAAALGAAYLAKIGFDEKKITEQKEKNALNLNLVCIPNKDSAQIYEPLLKKYRTLVADLIKTEAKINNR